jgi:hypothetical protein
MIRYWKPSSPKSGAYGAYGAIEEALEDWGEADVTFKGYDERGRLVYELMQVGSRIGEEKADDVP